MEGYISLGFNIAILVFVLIGVFWGFVRGLRKTACRGIFLIVTTILLLLLTPVITKALLGIKINITIELETTLSGSYSIKDILTFFMKEYLGESFVTKYPEFTDLIISMPLIVVNSIIYVLLFWICKYLLYPFNYLFYKLAFAPRHKKETLGFSKISDDNPFADFLDDYKEIKNDETNQASQTNNTSEKTSKEKLTEEQPIINESEKNIEIIPETKANETQAFDLPQNKISTPIQNSNENNFENQTNHQIDNVAPLVTEDNVTKREESNDNESKEGMFIVKDPEYNKHKKLTEEIRELTEKADKKEKKRLQKQIKKERKRIKKHRMIGALVGGVCGLIVMMNTFIPIYGLLDIFQSVNKIKANNITEDELSLTSLTNGLSDEILNGYSNSVFETITKLSGIKGISLASFDSLTTIKHGDTKITLRKDVESIANAIQQVDNFIGKYKQLVKDGNLSDLNKNELSAILTDTKTLLSEAKNIQLIDATSDYIIPITCSYILANEIEFTDNELINKMIANLILEMLESNDIDLFTEVNSLIEIAEYLNNQNILTAIFQKESSDPISIIKGLDNDFADVFTTKLYNLKLVDIALPYVLNISMSFVDTYTDFGYEENTATREELKVAITNLFHKTINFGKTLDSSSRLYLTANSLIPLGELLDVVKSSKLLTLSTYNNLISYTQNKLTSIMSSFIPTELRKSINTEVIGNISKVDTWQKEMTLINQAITLLRHKDDGFIGNAVEDKDLREGLSFNLTISEKVLINLGKAFDVLDKTQIFGSNNVRVLNLTGNGNQEFTLSTVTYVVFDILDYLDKNVLEKENYGEFNEFVTKVKSNLLESNHTFNDENKPKFWESEFTQISPLIVELSTIINDGNFKLSDQFGKKLDTAKKSTMFGNNACLTLMTNALEIVKDNIIGDNYVYNNGEDVNPQTLNDKIYELFDGISNKLNTNNIKAIEISENTFWEYEIDKYISLINIADKATSISSIDEATTLSSDLDNAFTSYTIPRLELSKTFAFSMKEVKYSNPDEDEYIKKQINVTIDNITNKLENPDFVDNIDESNFWELELSYISRVTTIDFDENLVDNLTTIGKTLDEVTDGYTKINEDNPNTPENEYSTKDIRPSKLLTHEDLRLLLASAIEECKESLISSSFTNNTKTAVEKSLTSIKTNMADITNIPTISFEYELGKLKTLSDLDIKSSYFQSSDNPTIQKENMLGLENLGNSLDTIAFNIKAGSVTANNQTNLIWYYNEELNSKIVTRPIISTLIADVFVEGKITDADDVNEIAYNALLDDIIESITNVSNNDLTFSWLRELGFINKLTQLEFSSDLDFDDVTDNVSKVLDGIAFNTEDYNGTITYSDILYQTNNGTIYPEIQYLPAEIFYDPYDHTTYGNSLFITRESILTALGTMINTIKKVDPVPSYHYDKEDIINELLDNVTAKVGTTDIYINNEKTYSTNKLTDNKNINSNNYYINISTAFKELNEIEKTIEEQLTLNGINSSNFDENTAINIDKTLMDIQSKKISGAITTRKMTIYALDSIYNSLENDNLTILGNTYTIDNHPAGKYLKNLSNYYKDNSTNTTLEPYVRENANPTDTDYPNPFVNLRDRIVNGQNYLTELNP